MSTVYATTGGGTGYTTQYYTIGTASSTAITWGSLDQWTYVNPGEYLDRQDGKLVVPKGRDLLLPDGSVLHVDDLGNYRLDDANAKVIHQANRMREFNPYVNASDLLASFIRYLGSVGLSRADAGVIPVVLFVNWLVIEAANADGDPVPDDVIPPAAHPLLKQLFAGKLQPVEQAA